MRSDHKNHVFSSGERYALGLVALSATLYGFLGYLGTQLLKTNFSVSSMLFWRFLIATIGMIMFGLYQARHSLPAPMRFTALIKPFILGALFYSGGSALFFMACQHTGTGLAMVIFFSYPLFVALFLWINNYRSINRYTLISLGTIMLGLSLLKGPDTNPLSLMGISLGVGAAICYAIYVFNSKKILTQLPAEIFTTLVCFSCAMVFFALAYTTHSFTWPTNLKSWCYIFAIGILATALPIQLLLKGMQVIGRVKACILSVIEPVVTLLIGVLLLGEAISPLQTLGVLVVMLGAIFVQFSRSEIPYQG